MKDTVGAERKFDGGIQKWEYHQIYIDTRGDVRGILSDAGKEGWELVGCLPQKGTEFSAYFYFKRPIIEDNV